MYIDIVVTHPELAVQGERWARHLRQYYAALARTISPFDLENDLHYNKFSDLYLIFTLGDYNLADGALARLDFSKTAVVNYSGSPYRLKTKSSPLHQSYQARFVGDQHGWTFCVQYDTFLDSLSSTARTSWLPICADHTIMTPPDFNVEHTCDVIVVGSRNDRYTSLVANLKSAGFKVSEQSRFLPGDFRLACLSAKLVIVNAGEPYRDWDVMPEVADALALGKSVLTNGSESLVKMFDKPVYLKTFDSEKDVVNKVHDLFMNEDFMSGFGARERVECDMTYILRADMLLTTLAVKG